MARRGGKAASRRSRQQRRAQRAQQQASQQPRPQQQTSSTAPEANLAAEEVQEREAAATPTSAPVDAFEAADAELRASTPPPGARPGARQQRTVRARTSDFNLAGGSSRLTERAAAEYHYVGRDLRNIGVLLVVMVVLLAISAIVVNLLGIGV